MKIVAIDFSSSRRSVAALQNDRVVEITEDDPRKTDVLAMLSEALARAGLERDEVECLAVGLGPGSYTGIRASIAMAQGWQLATGVRLLGISSAAVIAAAAQEAGLRGHANVVIDAQRGELYLSAYDLASAGAVEISPLQIVPPETVRMQESHGMLIGPEVNRWFENGRVIHPRAEVLARLAVREKESVPGEKLEPIYLRETTFVKAPPPRQIPGL